MLPSAPIKRMLCVCARLSQSVNSSGFCRRSPQWSFLAVQNNFLGWLYAICCQFKLQLCAQIWPQRATETAWCARCKHSDRENRGQCNSQLRGFLEQPANIALVQQRFTFLLVKLSTTQSVFFQIAKEGEPFYITRISEDFLKITQLRLGGILRVSHPMV